MNGNKIVPATGIVCTFPSLSALIDKLNDVLLGKEEKGRRPHNRSISMWSLDTAPYERHLMQGGYYNIHNPVELLQADILLDSPYIFLPVGLGVRVRTEPLQVHSTQYPSEITIDGDHIAIRTSYLDRSRSAVFEHHYGITARERY